MTTVSGNQLAVNADTICIHGDSPNAVEVAKAVREALAEEGVSVSPLREVLGAPVAG